MFYKVTMKFTILAVLFALVTGIYGCANQQKDEAEQDTVKEEQDTVKEESTLAAATEEISLDVTGMV